MVQKQLAHRVHFVGNGIGQFKTNKYISITSMFLLDMVLDVKISKYKIRSNNNKL